MEAKSLPIQVRRATEEDIGFIFNSWLKSYQNSKFCNNILPAVYFSEHHKVIEELLKTCEVLIACSKTDPTDIFAYICAERVDGIFVVHYVYTKHTYRKIGIAKTLINQFDHSLGTAAIYTHNTRIGETLAQRFGFVYSPYVALTGSYRKKAEKQKKKQDAEAIERGAEALMEKAKND